MKKKKLPRTARHTKPVEIPSMHYSIMMALAIANITSLGLAFVMAQMLGMSMGNVLLIGASQGINKANAQIDSHTQAKRNSTFPEPMPSCDARWAVCSKICDDEYSDNLLTREGWNRCEKDCDLRIDQCDATGQWQEEIKVRDIQFKT
jgi:hypothetical protein